MSKFYRPYYVLLHEFSSKIYHRIHFIIIDYLQSLLYILLVVIKERKWHIQKQNLNHCWKHSVQDIQIAKTFLCEYK